MTGQIRFCRTFDGARLAYFQAGRGPAMVEVATWLNHLEHDWKSPVWGPRLVELAQHYTLSGMTAAAAASPTAMSRISRSTRAFATSRRW